MGKYDLESPKLFKLSPKRGINSVKSNSCLLSDILKLKIKNKVGN